MNYKTIDGVSFNTDIISSWTKEQFLEHEMHNNHYIHMSEDEKKKTLLRAWNILSNKDGNTNSSATTVAKSKGKRSTDSNQ